MKSIRLPHKQTAAGICSHWPSVSTLKLVLILLLLAPSACKSQEITPDPEEILILHGHYDGPYILYHADKAVVIRTIKTNEGSKMIRDTLPQAELKQQQIKVYPDGRDPHLKTLVPFDVKLWDFNQPNPAIYAQPTHVFAISDIECSFSNTESILRAAGVINQDYQWIYGQGHLVVNGDMFSRGLDMMALLWLLYKLDYEATQAGGKVHIILGNHEAMNLSGDVRYVEQRYIEFTNQLNIPYQELFGANSELGRWLRTKNTIVKIGRNLIVHAGISPEFLEKQITIDQANEWVQKGLGVPRSQMTDPIQEWLFRTTGPLWYRGMVRHEAEYFPISPAQVDEVLEYFDVDRVIVGHTKGDDIMKIQNKKVVVIDVNHGNNRNANRPRGLHIYRNDNQERLKRINDSGNALDLIVF